MSVVALAAIGHRVRHSELAKRAGFGAIRRAYSREEKKCSNIDSRHSRF